MRKDQNLPNRNIHSNNSSGKPFPNNSNYSRKQSPYNTNYIESDHHTKEIHRVSHKTGIVDHIVDQIWTIPLLLESPKSKQLQTPDLEIDFLIDSGAESHEERSKLTQQKHS